MTNSTRSRPPARTRRRIAPVLMGVLVAVVALSACGSSSKSADTSAGCPAPQAADLSLISGGPKPTMPTLGQVRTEFGTVSTQGKALPNYPEIPPECYQDPAVGEKAPVVTGERFDGSKITLAANGKPTVIVLAAHWCPHCNRELPALIQEWSTSGMPKGVQLFSVTTGSNESAPNWPPSQWLTKLGWPAENLADNEQQDAARAYGLPGYPFIVMLKPDGTVFFRHSGEWPVADFQDEVARLVAASNPGSSAANSSSSSSAKTPSSS